MADGKELSQQKQGPATNDCHQAVHKVQPRADIVYTGNRMRKAEAVPSGSQKRQSNQVPLSVNQLKNR